MQRRTPSRRTPSRVRLPALLCGVAITLAGCSSSGGPGAGTSTATGSGPASVPGSTPASAGAPASSPVMSPTAAPSVTKRKVTRPAGARTPDFADCTGTTSFVTSLIEREIFAQLDRAAQTAALTTIGKVATSDKRTISKARRGWVADGYPAGFAVVQDLDGYLDAYTALERAGAAGDVDAVPGIYLHIKSLDEQFDNDVNSAGLCQQ
jgi:hypothetical protein